MIAAAIHEAGWESMRPDIYRCVVEYPILHARVGTGVNAPKP